MEPIGIKDTIRTLSAHIKDFRKDSILTPLSMILEVFMEILLPFLMSSIVDKGIYANDLSHIKRIGALMFICSVVGLFAGICGGHFGARASAGFARNLRQAMFRKIQDFSFTEIDKYNTSGLVTRLTTDVTNVQNAYQMLLRMFVRAPLTMICAMAMAFFINARIASIYLVAVLALALVLVLIMKRATKVFRSVFERYDDLNESVEENLSAIRVVKSYVREEHENGKFVNAVRNLYRLFVKAEGNIVIVAPIMTLTVYACIILISWVGAHMVVATTLTTGELMSLLTYCMAILMSLMMVALVFVMVTMSAASAQRICEVLKDESSLKNPDEPVFEVRDGSITFEDVDFTYTKGSLVAVLKDVSLSIRSGEVIGIIGGTGSAKTTLVNLISRLYDATQGVVKVGARDVRDYDLKSLRDQVAVVLQNNVLFSGTILENLRWGDPEASEEECRKVCRIACADEFIQSFPDQYETMLGQGGTNVSGGQKQRLCIARALLKKPKILILDDSTSAVDTVTDRKIRKGLREYIPGTTKIIITQRIQAVQDADRVIVLEEGRVDAFDTPENLLASNRIYQEVASAQASSGGDFDEPGDGREAS